MLERVWRKGNPPTLLVGMQTGAATMQNSMKGPLKIELTYDPAIPLLGMYSKKNIIQKDPCATMFPEALFAMSGYMPRSRTAESYGNSNF